MSKKLYIYLFVAFAAGMLVGIATQGDNFSSRKLDATVDQSTKHSSKASSQRGSSLETGKSSSIPLDSAPTESGDYLSIPKTVGTLLFDKCVDYNEYTITLEWQQKLGLTSAQNKIVQTVLRKHAVMMGQIEASTVRKIDEPNGNSYYRIEKNPDPESFMGNFKNDLKKELGDSYQHMDFLTSALGYSRIFSGFGAMKRDIYITDYSINGTNQTTVEVSENLSDDPLKGAGRTYTISPSSQFVKDRYPFLIGILK